MRSPHVNPSAIAFHTFSVHSIHPQCSASVPCLIGVNVGGSVGGFEGFIVGALVGRRIDDAAVVNWMVNFDPAIPLPLR